MDLARAYGERRGFSMPRSEVVVPSAADEQAERVAVGRAGFRERYVAHQKQRQVAAERDHQARMLAMRWDGLIKEYGAALPGMGTDPAFDAAREKLVAFGREVRERPELVAVLREREEAFGMAERPNLRRVLADARPERVIADMMEGSERAMRTEQQEQARQQAEVKLRQTQRLSRGQGLSLG